MSGPLKVSKLSQGSFFLRCKQGPYWKSHAGGVKQTNYRQFLVGRFDIGPSDEGMFAIQIAGQYLSLRENNIISWDCHSMKNKNTFRLEIPTDYRATDVPEGHLRCIENGKLIRFDSGKIVADADCSNATWFIFESTANADDKVRSMLKDGEHVYHLEYNGKWLTVDSIGLPGFDEAKSKAGRFKVEFDPRTFTIKMWHLQQQECGHQVQVALCERKIGVVGNHNFQIGVTNGRSYWLVFDGQNPDPIELMQMQKEGKNGFILGSCNYDVTFCGDEIDFIFHLIE